MFYFDEVQFFLYTLARMLYLRKLITKEVHNEHLLENRRFLTHILHLDFTLVYFITFYNTVFDIGRGSCLHL
jgi:hypothetical protein